MGILVLYIFTNISSYQMKERKNEEHPTPWHFIISLPCPWWAPYSEGGGCMLVSSYSCGLVPPFFGLLLPAIKNLIVFVLKMHNYTKWNTSKHLLTRLVYRAYLKSFNGRLCILNQEIITEFHLILFLSTMLQFLSKHGKYFFDTSAKSNAIFFFYLHKNNGKSIFTLLF